MSQLDHKEYHDMSEEIRLLRAEIFRLKSDAETRERLLDVNCKLLAAIRENREQPSQSPERPTE